MEYYYQSDHRRSYRHRRALGINPVFSNFQFSIINLQLSWVRLIVSTRITGGQTPCNSLLSHTI